jgi:protein-S-isoprenylcysteine O-methyltransferase Ste14
MNVDALSGPGIRVPPPVFYLGALAIGVALDSLWPLSFHAGSSRYILGFVVIVLMNLWVVLREERHLEAKFGEQYLRYRASVRRWL